MKRVIATALAAIAATSFMIGTVSSASAGDAADPAAIAASARTGITPNSQLPEKIKVDDKLYKVVETLRGVGKQVYDCTDGKYVFREPIAGLVSLRLAPAGIHGAGPFWASFDGSKVIGISPVADSVPSPAGPSNIAWLKVTAKSTAGTGGVFSKVAFIQRTDTRGGVAPATCAAPATVSVDYTTIYVFWAPK
jgi:Protein of unknown function (DUF3455)